MPKFTVVGTSFPGVDGGSGITGTTLISGYLPFSGTLYGKRLKSPYSYVRFLKIGAAWAQRLFGVRAVITDRDFPGIPVEFGPKFVIGLPSPSTRFALTAVGGGRWRPRRGGGGREGRCVAGT